MPSAREGTVIRVEGASCLVQVDGAGDPVRCALRRKLRWMTDGGLRPKERGPIRLAAGDRVVLGEAEEDGGDLVVEGVRPRRTKLARRAAGERRLREHVVAANVDQLAIVIAAADPEFNPGLADRLLVAAEKGGLEPIVLVNKVDLVDEAGRAAIEAELATWRKVGYRGQAISVRTGEGVEDVRAALRDRTTVLAGPSGSGKSSLVNAVEPGLRLATGEVSEATGKGRHTTTAVSLLPLASGGYVVDTPGVREFGFYDVTEAELPHLFREFEEHAGACRYRYDCRHEHEPGCAVRAAVERGDVAGRRYESYLRIRASLLEDA